MSNGTLWLALTERAQRKQDSAINQLMEGRSNATGIVTLSSTGATSTSVTAPTCGASSIIALMPQTSAAAAALATSYMPSTSVVAGSFVIQHSSSTSTSRVFGW